MYQVTRNFLCLLVILTSCSVTTRQYRPVNERGKWSKPIEVPGAPDALYRSALIRIYFPQAFVHNGSARTIIALHDFKGSLYDWGSHSGVAGFAERYNLVVVCPNMGQTTYETRFYPETTKKWNDIPGGKWIASVLVPFLRKEYGLASGRGKTGITGIGTGARGALLIAVTNPDIFGATAGLSGFYDLTVLSSHSQLQMVYGAHTVFPERWKKDDNIITLADNLKDTPVFLAHGVKDTEIPVEQSRLLGLSLRLLQKKNPGRYHFEYLENPVRGHDWRFWSSVTGDMMDFFNKQMK